MEYIARKVGEMREYIVQYERKEADNPKDKCDLCNHAIVGEVVRCKDCKNWRESHSEDEESYCYIDGRTTDSTDFCSWGERREP